MSVTIDVQNFRFQVLKLFKSWETHPESWGNPTIVCVALGKLPEEAPDEQLSSIFHTWIMGYKFTETLMFFQKEPKHVYFLTSAKKSKFIKVVAEKINKERSPPFKVSVGEKQSTSDFSFYYNLITKMKNKFGMIFEDQKFMFGNFVNTFFNNVKNNPMCNKIDISPAIRSLFSIKNEFEVAQTKKSSKFTTIVLDRYVRKHLELIINGEQVITHEDFSERIEQTIDEPSSIGLSKLNTKDVAPVYPILVTSGANVDLDDVESSKDNLSFTTINVILGATYKSYVSLVARTYMIDPSPSQKRNYNLLFDVYKFALEKIKAEITFSELYNSCVNVVKEKAPELVPYFGDDVGFLCGIETTPHKTQLIDKDNMTVIKGNMTFILKLSFSNVPEEYEKYKTKDDRKNYTIVIGNTILIPPGVGNSPKFLTGGDIQFNTVAYSFEDEDMVDDMVELSNILPEGKTRTRGAKQKQQNVINEYERNKQQAKILEKLRNEGRSRKKKKKKKLAENFSYEEELANGDISSYQNQLMFPKYRKNKIVVDDKNNSLLLPINGSFAPFHISTLRNVSSSKEADLTYIRFNFKHPRGPRVKKDYAPAEYFPKDIFLKEISFRTRDQSSASVQITKIKNMQKRIKDREKDINNRRQVEKQDKLIISRGNCPKLRDVNMRPSIRGRKTVGRLEAHENGFRFVSSKINNIVIIYSNIKHAFYQDAKKETSVIIHFTLKSAIIIGKKLVYDIQFYTEVMEEYEHLQGRGRRHISERESIYEERREKELRARLNKEFLKFAKLVEEKFEIPFQVPLRQLAFDGTPFKQNSVLIPTHKCLVNLTDYPFFVLTLDEIEVVFLERVQMSLRNFDMAFVYKDYTKGVAQIYAVPKKKIDIIKDWLTKMETKFYETRVNMHWDKVLKTVIEMEQDNNSWSPWEPGYGWDVFAKEQVQEVDVDDEDEDGEVDEYKPPSDDDEDEDEDDDEYDGELVNEEEAEEEQRKEMEKNNKVVVEEAKSWKQLEKEAINEDKRNRRWDTDFDHPQRKKRKFK